jgi:hypothetical protein
MSGRKIETVTSSAIDAGEHNIVFNISHLPPSVYFLKCTFQGSSITKKVIIE